MIQTNRHQICVVGKKSNDLCTAVLKVISTIGRASAELFPQQEPNTLAVSNRVSFQFASGDCETSGKRYTLVDAHGYIDAVKMLTTGAFAGATGFSAAILLFEVNEGVTPDLVHLSQLVREVGIQTILAFIDQPDKTEDPELIEMCRMEVEEATQLESSQILSGNLNQAVDYQGSDPNAFEWQPIVDLITSLNGLLGDPVDPTDLPLFAPIYEVENQEDGTSILACWIERGRLSAGQPVDIVGLGDRIRTQCVSAGQSTSVGQARSMAQTVCVDAEPGWISPGLVITNPKKTRAHPHFAAVIYALTVEEAGLHLPLISHDQVQVRLWSIDIEANLAFEDPDRVLLPSETVTAEISMETPLAMFVGASFEVKKMEQIVAMGIVTQILD